MRDCSLFINGKCSLGLFGGRPSEGICAKCDHRKSIEKPVAVAASSPPTKTSGGCGCQRKKEENGRKESMKLTDIEKAYFINLDRRPDRLEAVQKKLAEVNFPLAYERVQAIDGDKVAKPRWYVGPTGAWGCARSHLRILEDAQMQGIKSLCILEDDLYFFNPSTAMADMDEYLAKVPADWDVIMLGCQPMGQQQPVNELVHRAINCQRTHAYVARGRAIPDLYSLWSNSPNHIDWLFPQFMASHNVYIPAKQFVGQDEGKSDIICANNPRKLWRDPRAGSPVYFFKNTARATIEELRKNGFHFGNTRDVHGEDVGLAPIWRDFNPRSRETRLRNWINLIDGEAAAQAGTGVAIWCAEPDENLIRQVAGERLVVLDSPTVEQALNALAEHGGSA